MRNLIMKSSIFVFLTMLLLVSCQQSDKGSIAGTVLKGGKPASGMIRILDNPPVGNNKWNGSNPDPSSSKAPYRIYNIGNSSPVNLLDFIGAIEKAVGKKAKKNFLPMQPGDVPVTFADVEDLVRDFDYKPSTSIQEGVDEFVKWYREYYGI